MVWGGSWRLLGRSLVVLGGSWRLLSRSWVALGSCCLDKSISIAICKVLVWQPANDARGGGAGKPLLPSPPLARYSTTEQQCLQDLQVQQGQQGLQEDLQGQHGQQGLQGTAFQTAPHAWWPRRGRRIYIYIYIERERERELELELELELES